VSADGRWVVFASDRGDRAAKVIDLREVLLGLRFELARGRNEGAKIKTT
jgi:ribosomal protein L29